MVHHFGTELEPPLTNEAVKKLCEWAREELKKHNKKDECPRYDAEGP